MYFLNTEFLDLGLYICMLIAHANRKDLQIPGADFKANQATS